MGHLQVEHTSVIFLWCYQYYNGSVVVNEIVINKKNISVSIDGTFIEILVI
jgi:hypothetical protein